MKTRTTFTKMTGLASAVALALGFGSFTASANTAATNTANASTAGVEVIMVKGQKLARSVQETKSSVDVTTAQELADYNINDLQDVFRRTANVTSAFGGSGFTIRGIYNTNVTGTGVGDLATIYVDGAPLPRALVQTGPSNLWDISQIEVLRGPQSTLQGRNTLAGAVVISTMDPTYYASAKVRAQYFAKTNEQRLGVAFGAPIVDDQLAFRIAAEVTQEDGMIFNPTRNEYASAEDSKMIRAKFLYEPEGIEDLRILLSHTYDERNTGEDISFFGPGTWENREVLHNLPIVDNGKINLSLLNVQYGINENLDLTYVTTLDRSDRHRRRDGDYTAQDLLSNGLDDKPETITQELRLTYDYGSVVGLVGLYASDYDGSDSQSYSLFTLLPESLNLFGILTGPAEFGGLGLDEGTANIVIAQYAEGVSLNTTASNPVEISTKAIFADLTWTVNDDLDVYLGFRFDSETQEINATQMVEVASVLPDPTQFGPLAPVFMGINGLINADVAAANNEGLELDTDLDAFLPKLGFSYDITGDIGVGFTVQRGYRSGGVAVNPARATPHDFDQEYTWNYEAAFRSVLLDGDLTLNANAFYIDWEDQQVLVYLSDNIYDYETRNAGKSSIKGLEIEANFVVTDDISGFASLGLVKTEIENFSTLISGQLVDFSGNEFSNAPRQTFAIGGTWQNDDGWYASADLNYTAEQFERLAGDQTNPEYIIPSRTLINTKIGYRADDYGIYLVVNNLLNEEYYDNDFDGPSNLGLMGRYGEPRIIGLTIEAEFE